VLRAACCVLRAACCVLRAACCVLRAACCVLRAEITPSPYPQNEPPRPFVWDTGQSPGVLEGG
jgi:hypothetical protein